MKTKEIRLLKEVDAGKPGDVITTSVNTAEEFVKRGYAEYITVSLKETVRACKLHLTILGSRDEYCLVSKNHANDKVETVWLEREQVVPYVQKKNGEGYTCWISLNDKEKNQDKIEGVKKLCVLWFDIDSKRLDKSKLATEDELKEALQKAVELKQHLERKFNSWGYIAYSGNGYHVFFPLPFFELLGEKFRVEINEKIRFFTREVVANCGVEIDHTYDIRRVTTVIGSLNLKIPSQPLETCWSKEVFESEDVYGDVDKAREANQNLLEAILNMEIGKPKSTQSLERQHPRFEILIKRDEKLRDLYTGEWREHKYPTRSEAEEALLVKLVRYGFTDSEIHKIMEGSRIGKWFERVDSYREHSLEKAREYVEANKEAEPVALDHLNMIEDPNLAGKPVSVEAVVSSTSIAYLAPTEVKGTFEDKDGNTTNSVETIDRKDPINLKLVGINEDVKYRRLRRLFGTAKELKVHEKAWRTIYRVRVRPPVFSLEKREGKIFDERGFEYKCYDIYVTADKPVMFQPSSLIKLEGKCVPNPKTQKTTVLAYDVEFPEEAQLFELEKLMALKEKFDGLTVKERLQWILENFEIYAQIVERRNIAEAVFLNYFTPVRVRFNGDNQKGWGNILVLGDTTTAKSETLRKMISLLGAGMLVTAETATTVGLTGTATQMEKEGWFVDWGFLVLLDRKVLAIDGAHKLSLSNWACLAEAERSGVVSIAKAAKDSAYARTRVIKISNAVDPQADKYSTKSLATFLYPCQALPTVLDKTSIARLDLAVFADQRDVKPSEINKKFEKEYDACLPLLSEVLKWCWTSKADVIFTEEAVDTILEEATKLHETFFCESIPLASIDLKWKLARLSTALAYMTLSTEDFETLTVTKEHVEEVVAFLKTEYSKAGLNTLAQEEKYEVLTPEDVNMIIYQIVEKSKGNLTTEVVEDVFKFIVLSGRVTREMLKTKFGLTETNQLRPLLAVLANEKMVRAGRGLYPTPKLVEAYKNVIKVNKVNKGLEEPPKKSEADSGKVGGFSPTLVKVDNLDKKTMKGEVS